MRSTVKIGVLSLVSASAHAEGESGSALVTVQVTNHTSSEVHALYVAPAGAMDFQEELLLASADPSRVLLPGETDDVLVQGGGPWDVLVHGPESTPLQTVNNLDFSLAGTIEISE